MNIPDGMPVLSAGSHKSPKDGACIMEYASFLAGEAWSDLPSCTNKVLAQTAQQINDALNNEERQLLLPLLPRLMGTGINSPEVDLAIVEAAVQQVTHLRGHEDGWVNMNAYSAIVALDALKAGAVRIPYFIVWDARLAAEAAGMDQVDFLSSLIDAYDKATGRVDSPVVTEDDFRRLAELTAVKA